MSQLPLAPNGVFWTIQGEGRLIGEPMVFVRLAGCSVGCHGCDTDYSVAERVDVVEIVRRADAVRPAGRPERRVWITGGEPLDHAHVGDLIWQFIASGYQVALATSGHRELPHGLAKGLWWLSVSPHRADDIRIRYGSEVKLVPGLGRLAWDDVPALARQLSFPYKWIQPAWGDDVDKAMAFINATPGWALGIQAHKYWRLP